MSCLPIPEVREHPRRKDSARGSSLAPADTLPLHSCRASPSPATARHQRHGRGGGKADMLAGIEPPPSSLQTGRRCTHWRCASCGWTRRRLRSTTWSNGGRVGPAAVHHVFCADRAGPPPALTVARSTTSRCMARRPRVSEGGRDRPWAASGAGWRTVAVVPSCVTPAFCVGEFLLAQVNPLPWVVY